MLKIRQGLTLQQSTKHPGLFSRLLHGHQVPNLTEGHHLIDTLLWVSILEDSKMLGVRGTSSWFIRIHELLYIDPLRLVCVSPIKLFHLLHLGDKMNRWWVSCAQKEAKKRNIWKTYSCSLSRLKFFNRSVITELYVGRTIEIYNFHQF
jgi:hypothetical protein